MKRRPRANAGPPAWFGWIWLCVGTLFLAIGIGAAWRHSQREREYRDAGIVVDGMVLTKARERPARGPVRYRVTYRYPAPGADREGSGTVSREQWDALRERGPVRIRFLPATAESRIEGVGSSIALPLVFSILGTLLASGGYLVLRSLRRTRIGAAS